MTRKQVNTAMCRIISITLCLTFVMTAALPAAAQNAQLSLSPAVTDVYDDVSETSSYVEDLPEDTQYLLYAGYDDGKLVFSDLTDDLKAAYTEGVLVSKDAGVDTLKVFYLDENYIPLAEAEEIEVSAEKDDITTTAVEEDTSNSYTQITTVSESVFLNFSCDVYDIEVGQPQFVTFTAELVGDHDADIQPEVYSVQTGLVIGIMNDQGVDGDAQAGDQIYTLRVSLESPAETDNEYYANINQLRSESCTIHYYKPLAEAAFDCLEQVSAKLTEKTKDFYDEEGHLLEGYYDQAVEAASAALDLMIDEGSVLSYSVDDTAITIQLFGNLPFLFPLSTVDTFSGVGIGSIAAFKQDHSSFSTTVSRLEVDMTDTAAKDIAAVFPYYSFDVSDSFTNEEITLETVKQLGEYEMILWVGHGIYNETYGSTLLTRHVVSKSDNEKYAEDIAQGRIVIVGRYYAITGGFISKYFSTMDDAVIVLCVCESAKDVLSAKNEKYSLVQALVDKGAAAVLAMAETVRATYIGTVVNGTLDALIRKNPATNNYYTMQEALQFGLSQGAEKYPAVHQTQKGYPAFYPQTAKNLRLTDVSSNRIVGTVTDAKTGNALAGASIYIYNGDDVACQEIKTDANGNYRLRLPDDSYYLKVLKSGYEPSYVVCNVRSDRILNIKVNPKTEAPAPSYSFDTEEPTAFLCEFTDSSRQSIGVNDAVLANQLTLSGASAKDVSEIGLYLYDSYGRQLAHRNQRVSYTSSKNVVDLCYTASDVLRSKLKEQTTYQYRFYAVVHGVKMYGDVKSFRTKQALTITSQTDVMRYVLIPANYKLYCYDSALAQNSSRCVEASSTRYSIWCTKMVELSDGSVRYYFESGEGYGLYFVFTSDMTVNDLSGDCVVTLDPNGGTVTPKELTRPKSGTYGTLPIPTRTGYTFRCWSDTADSWPFIWDIKADNRLIDKNDHTLYARWKAQEYTIRFDANGGEEIPDGKTVTYDRAIGDLPIPTKEGYVFTGWYTMPDGGTQITASTVYTTDNDTVLYAQWETKEYTIRFDVNGGVGTFDDKKVTYSYAIGDLPIPTKEGYVFAGWYTMPNGGTQITASTIYTSENDTVLYARWIVDDASTQGVCGEDLTWTYDNDSRILEIVGTGDMDDFAPGEAPWNGYLGHIKTVVMDDRITSIGSYAFDNGFEISSANLPELLYYIGDFAFADCGLTNIVLPESVEYIGEMAFSCNPCEQIAIPANVSYIGAGALAMINGHREITVDPDNESYCSVDGVLYSKDMTILVQYPAKKDAANYKIPASVQYIAGYAMQGTNVMELTVPDTVLSIGHGAFSSCDQLKSVNISEDTLQIGYWAFGNAKALDVIRYTGSSELWRAAYPYDDMDDTVVCEGVFAFANGSGTEEDPYLVQSRADLVRLQMQVQSGHSFNNEYLKVTKDISFNTPEQADWGEYAYLWLPIGDGVFSDGTGDPEMTTFSGNFDGAGHTISGLLIEGYSQQGFFGSCYGATIKNLAVTDTYVYGTYNTGVLVGYGYGSNVKPFAVENCSVNAEVNRGLFTAANAKGQIGGLIGHLKGTALIDSCDVNGTVTARGYAGGVAGLVDTEEGGIVIRNCRNHAIVRSLRSSAGGIAGHISAKYGDVSVETCANLECVDGYEIAGGIVGECLSNSEGCTARIVNCYNVGEVYAGDYVFDWDIKVGGIAGYCSAKLGALEVINCFNVGDLDGDTATDLGFTVYKYIGGIVSVFPDSEKATISSSYYREDCIIAVEEGKSKVSVMDYGTALATKEMATQESFDGFDFETVWEMGQEHPIFKAKR